MKSQLNWQKTKKKLLKNSSVKKEYDKLALQYEIADKIISIRKKLNITQTNLANKTKTTQSAIARFEKAKQAPTLNLLCKIADALGYKLKIEFQPK